MSRYKELVLDKIGKSTAVIPNQLARVGQVFNIVPAQYTLIGSVSGVGKTSIVDDSWVLKPYEWITSTNSDIHFEGRYFSMERKVDFKLAKFASWKLYNDYGIRLSSNIIMGRDPDRKLSPDHEKLIKSFQPWMDDLLELIDITDGAKSVAEIATDIKTIAKRLGVLITSDHSKVYIDGVIIPSKKILVTTKKGDIPLLQFDFKGKSYKIGLNDKLYVPNHLKMIVLIILDHIGKIKLDGYANKKLAIDALDAVLSEARDLYSFNPIAISQFNRSLGDITRIKYSKGNLEPIYEDFKDTGNPVESADLVVSLFNPYKYQSWDSKGLYQGYDIAQGMVSAGGSQRFRSLHVLKNSFGVENVTFGLRFTAESMHFTTLPKANETAALQKIYEEIAQGK